MDAPEIHPLDDPLFLASEVRAQGLSWQVAADEVNTALGANYDSRSLRRLAYDDQKRWRKLMREADRTAMGDAGHEAQRVLRVLMRDEDDVKVRLKAAEIHFKIWSALLRHTPKGKRSGELYGMPDFEDNLTDDQLVVLCKDLISKHDDNPDSGDPNLPARLSPRDPGGARGRPSPARGR